MGPKPGPLRRKTGNSKSINWLPPLSANPRKTGSSQIEDTYVYVPIRVDNKLIEYNCTLQILNFYIYVLNKNCTFQISIISDRTAFPRILLNKEIQKLNSKVFIPYMLGKIHLVSLCGSPRKNGQARTGGRGSKSVSYTHLTLPTIYSV